MKLSNEAIEVIQQTLPQGSTILELGSGQGTKDLLDMGYKVISIEQDPEWQHKYHDNYIPAPIKNYDTYWWFDAEYLNNLPPYDFLLVDGPTGPPTPEFNNCRIGLLDHKHLFNLTVPILVDDTNRPDESLLAKGLIDDKEYTDYGRFILIHRLLEK